MPHLFFKGGDSFPYALYHLIEKKGFGSLPELKIRNVSQKTIVFLDQKAQEISKINGYKVSRNDLLKTIVEGYPTQEILRYKEDHFDQAVKLMTNKLQEYIDSNDALIKSLMFEDGTGGDLND